MSVRVLIAVDQPRARRSLAALRWSTPSPAEPPGPAGAASIEIAGEAEDGEELAAIVHLPIL